VSLVFRFFYPVGRVSIPAILPPPFTNIGLEKANMGVLCSYVVMGFVPIIRDLFLADAVLRGDEFEPQSS
jgi:hypothetical protein